MNPPPSMCRIVPPRLPVDPPKRDLAEIDAPDGVADQLVRVATARVVLLDHALLAHDMPALSDEALGAAGLDPVVTREAWMLEQAGLVSLTQAAQAEVNTPIATIGEPRLVWRPPRYGRAAVLRADWPGNSGHLLLDLKGVGRGAGHVPARAHHSSGLCSLREALREVLMEAIIAAILARAAPDLWTVPAYAVLDLGFDALTHRGEQLPAAVLVRRAHARDQDEPVLPWRGSAGERVRLEIELLLRAYGLTSSNAGSRYHLRAAADGPRIAYVDSAFEPVDPRVRSEVEAMLDGSGDATCDGINIQLARLDRQPGVRAHMVDFGHYEVRRRFDRALVSMVCDAPHRWGACLTRRDSPQPDPALAAPLAHWARQEASAVGSLSRNNSDPPTLWADATARAFRTGEMSGEDIADAIAQATGEIF
ncbi:hypothetical protein [Sphingomonas sp.]|uniref:hypothetical protein n=1 Tax=Sphingomonas sp. TaxID=28214 RepID=UPI003D6D6987